MMSVSKRLRARLGTGPMIIAPGISDAFGARLVEQAGFEVAYLGGNSVSALLLGQRPWSLNRQRSLSSTTRSASCRVPAQRSWHSTPQLRKVGPIWSGRPSNGFGTLTAHD